MIIPTWLIVLGLIYFGVIKPINDYNARSRELDQRAADRLPLYRRDR